MTSPRDRSCTAVRRPPARAQRGDSGVANAPTFCSASVPRPLSPGLFDSGDPRCTSHTVPTTYSRNCRYSDCQFSATSVAKLDEVR
jgi:hypothetical protein